MEKVLSQIELNDERVPNSNILYDIFWDGKLNFEARLSDPKLDAELYELTGDELEMQYMGGLIEYEEEFANGMVWACPICMTDAHLTDL